MKQGFFLSKSSVSPYGLKALLNLIANSSKIDLFEGKKLYFSSL